MMNQRASFFPVYALDFEASALERSYPIEIGVAWWHGPGTTIDSWSALIRPTGDWIEKLEWSEVSADVDGIDRAELDKGLNPGEALQTANSLIGERWAFCDGGAYDRRWLRQLAEAAGMAPTFRLGDWDTLGGFLSPEDYRRMFLWLDEQPTPHRAAADAVRLLKALAVGMGYDDVGSQTRG